MTNIKDNERFVPMKNYVIAIGIVVVIIALTWYAFAWYKVVKENKLSTSYLVKEKIISKEIKDIDEVNNVFSEVPNDYFVYISYTGSKKIYDMERQISDLISSYNLDDNFYYWNVTSIKDESDTIEKINNTLNLTDLKVEQIPTIIYFKDRKAVDIINRDDDNIMDSGDFQKCLM